MSQDQKKALGRILLEQRAVNPQDLERVLAQEQRGVPLASRLIEQGLVTEVDALKALSTQRGVPGIDLHQICVKLADLNAIPRDIALVHKLLPVLERQDRIFVAMANPEDKKVLEELEFVTGKRVFAYIALEAVLMKTIRDAYDARDRGESHFVGPACPIDMIRKAGLDPASYGRSNAVAAPTPVAAAPAPFARAAEPARPAPTPTRNAPPAPPPTPPAAPPVRTVAPIPTPSAAPVADNRRSVPVKPPLPRDEPAAPVRRPGAFHVGPTNTESRFRPSTQSMPAVRGEPTPVPDSAVIVDDRMQRVVESQELNEADFGDVSEELSLAAEMPRAPSATPVPPGRKKILVVDDEADIRRLLRKILEEKGHVVVEADRGKLALQLVKVESPDLVVLDAMLPEVHGFDIAKRIRNSSRYGHIPIIMVSAVYRGWRFAQDAKQSYGVDAYIEKPFKVQEVLETVERALRTKRGGVDPEVMNAEAERLLKDGVEAYKAGDYERATDLLQRGVQIDPLAYRLRYHLGLLLGKRGLLYDAIEQLERAVQMQSEHFASIKNLAILYQQAGFRNKALEAWERALTIAPDEDTKKAIKEHIVSIL